jgi:hypothetical protein
VAAPGRGEGPGHDGAAWLAWSPCVAGSYTPGRYRALALFVRGSGAEMATKVYLALLATVNVGG